MLTITIDDTSIATPDAIRERLERACEGSALAVGGLHRSGPSEWRADIRCVDHAIALGVGSYLEVLHRIARSCSVSDASIAPARRVAVAS